MLQAQQALEWICHTCVQLNAYLGAERTAPTLQQESPTPCAPCIHSYNHRYVCAYGYNHAEGWLPPPLWLLTVLLAFRGQTFHIEFSSSINFSTKLCHSENAGVQCQQQQRQQETTVSEKRRKRQQKWCRNTWVLCMCIHVYMYVCTCHLCVFCWIFSFLFLFLFSGTRARC